MRACVTASGYRGAGLACVMDGVSELLAGDGAEAVVVFALGGGGGVGGLIATFFVQPAPISNIDAITNIWNCIVGKRLIIILYMIHTAF